MKPVFICLENNPIKESTLRLDVLEKGKTSFIGKVYI